MKKNNIFMLMMLVLSIFSLTLVSCNKGGDDDDDGDGSTPKINALKKKQLVALMGTWELTSVEQNQKDPEFELEVGAMLAIDSDTVLGTNNFYTITDGNYVMPSASNKTFDLDELSTYNAMTLEDGYDLTISEISSTEMKLSRVVNEEITSRAASIGTYDLYFTKK